MSTISNAISNAGEIRLARQFANITSRQSLGEDKTLPASENSTSHKPDILNSQLTSMMNKLSDASQAINKLSNAAQDISQSRKAYAAEVLRRIKEQMRIMMLLTAGDPKARARQITAMARELAAAAREYAAASGDTSQVGEAATNASEPAASSAETTARSEQNIMRAEPEAAPTTTTSPAEPTPYQANSTHQVYEQLAHKISAYNQASSISKEDQEFALEVKKLAAQLKALANQTEAHKHKRPDQSTERETADTNEALKEVEHSVAIIESPNVSSTPSINIVAG